MTRLLDIPILAPVLIGRAPELDALNRLVARAATGRGQTTLIAGEAGIGKSRLVAEVTTQAQRQGFAVLQGRCFEPDRVLPYAPLLDLLRVDLATRRPDAIVSALGPMAPQLAGLLPEYRALLADLPPLPPLDSAQERRRIAPAFVQLFIDRAARQPHLVIVEDLHWSDDASLDVVLALARRIATQPILLLLTYRSDELHADLVAILAELERERLAGELRVAPLAMAEVDVMLRAIFNQRQPIRSEFVSALYALTEGNPFFIEEILKALVTAGDIFYADGQWDRKPLGELHIPRTVQVAVKQRFTRLGADAQRLLVLVAVAGRRFDFELLQRLTGHNEARLLELIKSLIAAQLVVEETAETFAFRHALTRAALYADLLARERRALHGQIAEALEVLAHGRGGAAHNTWVADLAYHYYEAEIWPKALAYAQQAGIQAQRLHAPRAAIEQLSRAIEAARRLAQPPSPALYRARGQMRETLGAFEAARDDYHAALAGAQALGDRQTEWQALLDLGFLWAARDYRKMGEYRQRALDLARTLDNPVSLGHSLNRVGNWHLFVEQPGEALRYHQEALALFQAANERSGLAATYDLMGVTQIMAGDILAGVEHYEQAVAIFRELGDRQGLASSLATLAMRGASYPFSTAVCPPSDWAACRADGTEALRLAREIGWRSGEANALIYLAYAYGPRGEYARALECAWAGLEIAQEIEHRVWLFSAHLALGVIGLDLLDCTTACQQLEQSLTAAREIGMFFARIAAGFLASACVAQGDVARAQEVLAAVLDTNTPMETSGQRLAWCARAELALAEHDPALALQIVDQLIASAAHVEQYGAGCVPRLWHLRGVVLAALGRLAEAEVALSAAATAAERWALRPLLWRIQVRLGKMYHSQARRKQAQAAFSAARAIVEDLTAFVPDDDLRAMFLRSATEQLPRLTAPTPRRAAKAAFDGLTQRERDVAALIVQDRSNREIADALFVGERTVETHISNILSKLGFTSRRQIATWATRNHLANEAE